MIHLPLNEQQFPGGPGGIGRTNHREKKIITYKVTSCGINVVPARFAPSTILDHEKSLNLIKTCFSILKM